MELTKKQQSIKERKQYVYDAYINKPAELATTSLVKTLASKFKITEVQVYNDIKSMKK